MLCCLWDVLLRNADLKLNVCLLPLLTIFVRLLPDTTRTARMRSVPQATEAMFGKERQGGRQCWLLRSERKGRPLRSIAAATAATKGMPIIQ